MPVSPNLALVQFDLGLVWLGKVATRHVIIWGRAAIKGGKVYRELRGLPLRLAATVRQKSTISVVGPRPDFAVRDAMGVPIRREFLHVGGIDLERIHLRQGDGHGKAVLGGQLTGLPLGIGLKFPCGPFGFATNCLLLKTVRRQGL